MTYRILSHTSPQSVPTDDGSRESKANNVTVAVSRVVVVIFLISLLCVLFWRRHHNKQINKGIERDAPIARPEPHNTNYEIGVIVASDFRVFHLSELKFATNKFSEENELGQGGFGPVYKGTMPDGKQIAVKRLAGWSKQGLHEFKTEVDLLAKLRHKNLVKLLGYCLENNEKLLCYEYLPRGSLDCFIFDKNKTDALSWESRYKIIEGISSGLNYLHIASGLKIIHRDLKPSNILLDEHMNPKVSDFGLARLYQDDRTHMETSKIAGTYGYMAPEYAMHGIYSEKADVYSFGVMLLEIVTGQKNSSFCNNRLPYNLIIHILQHWSKGEVEVLKDPTLDDACLKQLSRCIHIGLLCVQENPNNRASMEAVNFMLRNDSIKIPPLRMFASRSKFLLTPNSMSSVSNSDLTCSTGDHTSSTESAEAISIQRKNTIAVLTR